MIFDNFLFLFFFDFIFKQTKEWVIKKKNLYNNLYIIFLFCFVLFYNPKNNIILLIIVNNK